MQAIYCGWLYAHRKGILIFRSTCWPDCTFCYPYTTLSERHFVTDSDRDQSSDTTTRNILASVQLRRLIDGANKKMLLYCAKALRGQNHYDEWLVWASFAYTTSTLARLSLLWMSRSVRPVVSIGYIMHGSELRNHACATPSAHLWENLGCLPTRLALRTGSGKFCRTCIMLKAQVGYTHWVYILGQSCCIQNPSLHCQLLWSHWHYWKQCATAALKMTC